MEMDQTGALDAALARVRSVETGGGLVLHVLPNFCVPTVPDAYRCDAFNEMAMRFSRAMAERGHIVYFYGNCSAAAEKMAVGAKGGTNAIVCAEYVPVEAARCEEMFARIQAEIGSFNRGAYLQHLDSPSVKAAKAELNQIYGGGILREVGRRRLSKTASEGGRWRELAVGFYTSSYCEWFERDYPDLPFVHAFVAGGYVSPRARNILFCSKAWQTCACELYKLAPANSIVLPPFFYPDDYKMDVPRKTKTCLHLGRAQAAKGAHSLFELAKTRPDWTFWLAGQGDALENGAVLDLGKDDLRRLSDYPNLHYWGYANSELRRRLLNEATVLLQMSPYLEPFGLNVIEAALAGTPAIVPDFAAFVETVAHGETGYRVPARANIEPFLDLAAKLDTKKCIERGRLFSVERLAPFYVDYLARTADIERANLSPPPPTQTKPILSPAPLPVLEISPQTERLASAPPPPVQETADPTQTERLGAATTLPVHAISPRAADPTQTQSSTLLCSKPARPAQDMCGGVTPMPLSVSAGPRPRPPRFLRKRPPIAAIAKRRAPPVRKTWHRKQPRGQNPQPRPKKSRQKI
jgi:glycosyltransferase involved in cell wall biosynthesis